MNTKPGNLPFHIPRVVRSQYGYKGVDCKRGHWYAYIGARRDNNFVRRGPFSTVEDAAQIYDEMARDRYGPFAVVNFPLNGEKQAIVADPGRCAVGHLLEKRRWSGKGGGQCRACAAAASQRRRDRRKALGLPAREGARQSSVAPGEELA